jgi:hypothetical protein
MSPHNSARLRGSLVRVAMVYAALVAVMHASVLGPLGAPLRVPLRLLAVPFTNALGLAEYPMQGELLLRLFLSLAVGAVWWLIARDRNGHPTMFRALLAELRFVLAAGMIAYGLGHLLAVTSPFPSQADWIRPIREMEAPEFMTIWFGSSPLQKASLGLSGLAAGLCLLSRRTATFGAFLGVGVIGNEAFTQLSFGDMRSGRYWLPFELAGIGTALLLADLRRVLDAFIYEERTVPALQPEPAWPDGLMARLAQNGTRLALVVLVLANLPTLIRGFDGLYSSRVAGVYYVDTFSVNGQPVPLEQGGKRWRWVAIDDCDRFAVRTIADQQLEGKIVLQDAGPYSRRRICSRVTEPATGMINIVAPDSLHSFVAQPGLAGSINYTRAGDGALDLDGTVGGVVIKAHLRRMADSSFRVFKYETDSRL